MTFTLKQDFTQTTRALAAITGPTLTYGANTSDRRYFNSAGLLAKADNNEPRLGAHLWDANAEEWVPRGLLINTDPTTNLCLKSDAFDASEPDWTNGSAVSTKNETGPDGVANSAWTISNAGGIEWLGQSFTVADDSLSHIFSVYIKKTTGATVFPAYHFDYTGGAGSVFSRGSFDTNTGERNDTAGLGPDDTGVEDCGTWWRFWVKSTNNTDGNTTLSLRFYPYADSDGNGSNDGLGGTGSHICYGPQVEKNEKVTSYVASTASVGVRDADSLTTTDMTWLDNTSTAVGSFILKCMFQHLNADAVPLFQLDDGTAGDRIWVEKETDHRIDVHTEHSAGTDGDCEGVDAISELTEFEVGFTYANNNLRASVDASQIVSDSSAAMPVNDAMTTLSIGTDRTNGGEFFLKELRYHNEVIRDAKIVFPEKFTDTPTTARSSYMVFGDSQFAAWWRSYGVDSNIVTSGGVTTLTLDVAHNIPIGTRILLGLSTSTLFWGQHIVTATPSSTQISFAAPAGAPASEAAGNTIIYAENDQIITGSAIDYLRAFSRTRFELNGRQWAMGGDDINEALTRAPSTSTANRVLIMVGTNDALIAISTNASAEISDYEALLDHFLGTGAVVDACTVPPFGPAYVDIANTTKRDFKINLNNGIRAAVAARANCNLFDWDIWFTDQGNANKQAIADVMNPSDGIHIFHDSSGGWDSASRIGGEYMAAFYDQFLGTYTPSLLPESNADCITEDPRSRNILENCTFELGTTNWTRVFAGAGNSQVVSAEARTVAEDGDAFGSNYKAVNTVNSSGSDIALPFSLAKPEPIEGKNYIARGAVTIDTDGTLTTTNPQINIGWTQDGYSRQIRVGLVNVEEDGNWIFETPPILWPGSESTSQFFHWRCLLNGTGATITIEWGRLQFFELGGANVSQGFLVSVGQLMN